MRVKLPRTFYTSLLKLTSREKIKSKVKKQFLHYLSAFYHQFKKKMKNGYMGPYNFLRTGNSKDLAQVPSVVEKGKCKE